MLTGKYIDQHPKNARLNLFPEYKRYSNKQAMLATRAYVSLAQKNNLSPAQMALAFVNSRPFMGANIIGATSLVQLQENLESTEINLSEDVLQAIDQIHQQYPNPCP